MRKLLLCFLMFFPLVMSAQWNLIAYRQGSVFLAKNADTIFTASSGGLINLGYNEGATWSMYDTEIFGDCWAEDIQFPTASVGYICGGSAFGIYKQFIIKTTDGGVTWDSLGADITGGFGIHSLWFVNADTGFIAAGGLFKTTDGGVTFSSVSIPPSMAVKDIYFIDEQNGFLSTNQYITSGHYVYRILKTNNGGDSWVEVYTDSMTGVTGLNHRTINEIVFIDDNNGFAVGGNGLFLKTTDGGNSWTISFIHPYSNLTSVDFLNTATGYINNAGSIFKTNDGGNSWHIQTISPVSIISKIDMINDTLGYAFSGNEVYKTTNGGGATTSIQNPQLKSQFKIYSNPTNDKINIDYPNEVKIQNIQLVDITGKLVKSFCKNEKVLNVNDISSGMYFLNIQTKEGNVSEKIIVK